MVCGEGIKYADGTPVSASVVKGQIQQHRELGAMGGASVAIEPSPDDHLGSSA
ncbi:MAG: hypothetical protein MZV63_37560 [Marinilabiliales bacterium]|nr:hypothetical protein [Marinilabiliales bacterium]